jgi:hypothetical protein
MPQLRSAAGTLSGVRNLITPFREINSGIDSAVIR